MSAPHLLILDEPTNHLDIDSRRALLDALNDYSGAVILITHDRSLMELVADRLWLAMDGGVKPFDGDMDDYARLVLGRAREAAKTPAQAKPAEVAAAPPPQPAASPGQVGPLKRKLQAAEAAMNRGASEVAEIDHALSDTSIYLRDAARATELAAKRAKAQARLAKAEAEWIAAAEAYDAASAGT
jgi:ATP-binding cassette subfamily F protein 3